MKKCLVVLTMGILALVLCTSTASANILSGYTACGGAGGPTGSTAFILGGPPSGSTTSGSATLSSISGVITATITCSAISGVPLGDYLTQVDLYLKDDASTPAASGSSVLDTWTGLGTVAFNVVITTPSTDGVNFTECYAGSPSNLCPIYEYFPQTGTPTSFGAFSVTVSAAAGALGGVGSLGSDSANLYVQYEYAPTAPEPATLSLMGGALLGLALFGRKLFCR
jgi:hypothetical protein